MLKSLKPSARRAKIVATLGPSTESREQLTDIIRAGVDIVRMNFSHGTHAEHQARFDLIKEIAKEEGRNVGVLADLQGPKIRLGLVPDPGIEFIKGESVYIFPGEETLESYEYNGAPAIPVVYAELAKDVVVGSMLLIDDGSLRLVVSKVEDNIVQATVIVGGLAKSRKGLNLPGVAVSAGSLTPKDIEDLNFAVEMGVDWLALSFVRTAKDVLHAKKLVNDLDGEQPIIAKLERPEAIDNLDEIVDVADAVMVARGDLGVEVGPERVPAIQKQIITKANAAGRPVITATEMLDSMIRNPRPTRAEASDVANAVFDGTDAVMLSGETAAGAYPAIAVDTMANIVAEAESHQNYMHKTPARRTPMTDSSMFTRVVSQQAVELATLINARCIAVMSMSGWTVQLVSKSRPPMPLVGLLTSQKAIGRTALMWGVESRLVPVSDTYSGMLSLAETTLMKNGFVEKGEAFVLVSGTPGNLGGTSRIWVHRAGDAIRR